ncbi:MAG: hypothetical protein GX808_08515 [Syntrophomonadaceae bacterium]|jgi:hypothetical protein|nr:hypothetical protein [Syntrophomonadaceae bacterium]
MSKARGIVLESNNGCSTVLMEGGQYIKIRKTLEVGQIYQQERQYYKLFLAVASAVVLILLGTVDFFNVVAYANVSNGIEMGVNRWNRVVKIEQIQETDMTSTKYDALKGQKLERAVSIIVKDALVEDKNEEDIIIQVNSEKKANPDLEQKLLKKIETSIENDFIIPEKEKAAAEEKIKNSIKVNINSTRINKVNNGNKNLQGNLKERNNQSTQGEKTDDKQGIQAGKEANNQGKPDNNSPNKSLKNPGKKNPSKPDKKGSNKPVKNPENKNPNNSRD